MKLNSTHEMPIKNHRVQILVQQFTSSFGLPFEKILPATIIEETLKEENLKYRQRLFSPIVTLWAFLSQVLDKDKTCLTCS